HTEGSWNPVRTGRHLKQTKVSSGMEVVIQPRRWETLQRRTWRAVDYLYVLIPLRPSRVLRQVHPALGLAGVAQAVGVRAEEMRAVHVEAQQQNPAGPFRLGHLQPQNAAVDGYVARHLDALDTAHLVHRVLRARQRQRLGVLPPPRRIGSGQKVGPRREPEGGPDAPPRNACRPDALGILRRSGRTRRE